MPKCPTIDRLELTRRKFAKNLTTEKEKLPTENLKGSISTPLENNDWDGVHCPECGKKLEHVSGCIICTCGWSKC